MENELNIPIQLKNILKFSLPTIVAMLFMSIYSIVDGVCVSNFVGTNALSAINVVMPIIIVTMALGTMLGTGGSAIIAKKMGEKKLEEAKGEFSFILLICFGAAIIISSISLIFLNPILKFLGTTELLYNDCKIYTQIALYFAPIIMPAITYQMFFITAGKTQLGLLSSVIGGVTNIVLDLVFVGKLNWGIAGAAVATGLGYSIPGIIGTIYFFCARKGSLYFIKPRVDFKMLLKSCTNGASEMVTSLATAIITVLLNLTLLNLAGEDGVAAITIILYGQMILAAIYQGYAMGIAPIISYNYGKEDKGALNKIIKLSLKLIIAVAAFSIIFTIIFTEPLIGIFAQEGTNVYQLATSGFRIFAISFVFMGFGIFGSAAFTALSNGKISAIISFFRTLVFIVIAIITLPKIIGITGVWLAIPIAEILATILSFYFLKKYKTVYGY